MEKACQRSGHEARKGDGPRSKSQKWSEQPEHQIILDAKLADINSNAQGLVEWEYGIPEWKLHTGASIQEDTVQIEL